VNEQHTALWERRLGDGLNAIVEEEAPAATVTMAEVIRAGRLRARQRRHRTAFTLCAVLVVAVALTAGVLVVSGHLGNDTSPPAHDGTPSGAVTASIGTSTDPVAPTIAFGWLPSYLNGEYEVFQDATGPDYTEKVVPGTGLPPFVGPGGSTVQIWAPGDVILTAVAAEPGPSVDPAAVAKGEPAGTVRGRQAWWIGPAPGTAAAARAGDLQLEWQYGPDAWAVIYYHGGTGAATGSDLMRVASGLVIGPVTAVPLPFHMKSLPNGMHAENAVLDFPHQGTSQVGSASLRFCISNPCFAKGDGMTVSQFSTTWQNNSSLAVDGAPMIDPRSDAPVDQKQTIPSEPVKVDGHPGKLWITDTGVTLDFDYDASVVQIMAAGAEYEAIGGKGGLLTFADSLEFYGSDPARWTTSVIG
jgi:hypothetical protein